ncbi:VWA domain-containing protein, partial [Streptomyces sp. DT225]
DRTIRANLKNYLELPGRDGAGTVVPERLIGYGRAAQSVKKDVILCIDQSGSMAASVVYASVFGAVLASMRALRTRLVVFDTAVVDLTDQLAPAYDRDHAAALSALGAPAFACTPDLFPDVMAAAIEKRPLPVPDPETAPTRGIL